MVLPKLPRDAGDRNRTSPFAFTGNKFEFRAVSSGQSIAYPNIALNMAVTESLDYMATELEKAIKGGKSLEKAVAELLPKVIKENKRIIFNGNNYSKEWEKEAGKRGLLNLKNTVDALPQLVTKEVVGIFEKYKVLNERELHARYEIMLEQYNKTVNIEGQLMVLMANRYILPAAFEYQRQVAASVAAVKAGGRQVGRGQEDARSADEGRSTRSRSAPTSSSTRSRTKATGRRKSTPSTSATSSGRPWKRCARPATSSSDDAARAVAARHVSRDALHQVAEREAAGQGKGGFRKGSSQRLLPALLSFRCPHLAPFPALAV